jgi:putative serine protease PepD
MLIPMTDDQTTPEAAGGQSTPTSTTVGETSAPSPESPPFPVPPPPGPYVASPDEVTLSQASAPGEPSPVPYGPAPGGAYSDPSDPSTPSAPFDAPPAPGAVGADAAGRGAPPMPPTPPPAGPASVGSSAPPSPSRWGRRAVAVLAAAGLMAGAAAGGALLAVNLDDDDAGTATTSLSAASPAVGSQDNAPDEPLSQVAAAVLPSVVSITSGAGEGSGVIISSDGQILTNNHVVAQAADGGSLSVTFSDGSKADARILGRDPATDLAVIQAEDVDGLTPAKLGSSADLHVGDTVLAIGSPLGLEGSVSSGIVSALDRSITLSNDLPESPFGNGGEPQATPSAVIDAIQTDAAINPGNSGGALINADGEVVGINTAIASLAGGGGIGSQGGNIGVGFAIPIDSARSIAEQLVDNGEVTHAFLGVRIADAEDGGGAVVGQVDDRQPAAKAGLEQGDIITKVDDTEITSGSDLTSAIRSHEPGDKVTITYTRDGDEKTAEVTLGELPTD